MLGDITLFTAQFFPKGLSSPIHFPVILANLWNPVAYRNSQGAIFCLRMSTFQKSVWWCSWASSFIARVVLVERSVNKNQQKLEFCYVAKKISKIFNTRSSSTKTALAIKLLAQEQHHTLFWKVDILRQTRLKDLSLMLAKMTLKFLKLQNTSRM